ncbi:MAG: hypothetical protein JNM36_17655, partial [Chitinophagales bacterium]|nr:hypothetical protein [Chitinophagales bacterium]
MANNKPNFKLYQTLIHPNPPNTNNETYPYYRTYNGAMAQQRQSPNR